ncbi:MAG: TlpA family protein disulfide reductase [Gammaproteobacteria bacterium]
MTLFRILALLAALSSPLAQAEPVDFTLPDVQGVQRSLSEFRGKWVVVNYWATWCPPCLEEIPDLVAFHERHQDTDAVVLGINYENIPEAHLRAFVDEYFISYPVLRNGDIRPPHERLSVGGLPTTYIISPEGEPVARQVGTITSEDIESYIERQTHARAAAAQAEDVPAPPAPAPAPALP